MLVLNRRDAGNVISNTCVYLLFHVKMAVERSSDVHYVAVINLIIANAARPKEDSVETAITLRGCFSM